MGSQQNIYIPPKSLIYENTKRLFDVVLAIFVILMFLPLFIIIATIIKFTSPGAVFYRGIRTGLNGKNFKILKFRSMYTGSDKGPGTTSKTDTRITLVGAYIRKHKLDELPQLFNIVFGDMSFVGPRPELKRYTDLYKGDEKLILTVRPGLTDISSLHFSNLNELINDIDPDKDFEQNILPKKNRLRVEYVKKRNFLLDLTLILKTILKVTGLK